jgi:DNA-binding NtrC family response regulator
MENLLIIDDNIAFLEDVKALLERNYNVIIANNATNGLEILKSKQVNTVLLDLHLPDMHGLQVLEKIRGEIDPYLPVIIITEFDNTENVVKAMRMGANDFLTKDFNLELLYTKILKALEQRRLEIEISALKKEIEDQQNTFIFKSVIMKQLNVEITRLAQQDFDILIEGETGSGKDLIASLIHLRSSRSLKPYLTIPIRTLSETVLESELFGHEKGAFTGADNMKLGKFEAANSGTIYIPEITALSEGIQLKLLNFMQYKTISRMGQDPRKGDIKLDVRVILATNENLEELVAQNKIREDFFYRISGVRLSIPPLRKRKDDIENLAMYFLDKHTQRSYSIRYSIDEEVFKAFQNYDWPGNVRELENSIKSALSYSKGDKLTINNFPILNSKRKTPQQNQFNSILSSKSFPGYKKAEVEFKKEYLFKVLELTNNNIIEAAKIMEITPQGLRKFIKNIKIDNI